MRHKHADVIIAWAMGAIIEFKGRKGVWQPVGNNHPSWHDDFEYRVKPKDKVKVYRWAFDPDADGRVQITQSHYKSFDNGGDPCVRLDWTMKEIEEE